MKRIIFILIGLLFISYSNAQQLETLIAKALANSPKIQKFELQYSIAKEKVNETKALPNTEFGVGYFVSEPETRTGAQRFKISAKQMIPWFGSITARENYISSLADAKYEDIVIAKRKLVASVSQSYYNLYANKAKQYVLIENIELLKTYETLALTSVEVNKASVVDVLSLQMKKNELNQLLMVLKQDFLAEQTLFNKLLNREKSFKVQLVEELTIPSENSLPSTKNLTLHPELLKYDRLYKSVQQSNLLHQKEASPMIGFGLDYIAVSERPNMSFGDNGKDIIMPMLSLSIPIFKRKYTSQSKQNKLKQQEIIAQKQDRLNILETELDKAINNQISATISYNTQVNNLKQAKYTEEILIKSYETGIINFKDVLYIQELQLKFQISQIESVKSYYIQATIINYLSN